MTLDISAIRQRIETIRKTPWAAPPCFADMEDDATALCDEVERLRAALMDAYVDGSRREASHAKPPYRESPKEEGK